MKIRRVFVLLICSVITVSMAGCGNENESDGRTANKQAGVEEVLQAGMTEADAESGSASSSSLAEESSVEEKRQSGLNDDAPEPVWYDEEPVLRSEEGIDVDLTALSSTMVYSEVYNMMSAPEEYIGKTVKMDGLFAVYHDEASDSYYYACIIRDATACCAQGVEFVLTDEYTWPDDYPKEGEEVCVEGVFDTYQEGEYTYCTLRGARLV